MRRAIIAIALAAAALAGAAGCSSGGSNMTLPHASCGYAFGDLSATTQFYTADRGALTCFTAAARTCKAAGLSVGQKGDAGTDYVFVITSGGTPGHCAVTEYSQRYADVQVAAVNTFQCYEVAVTSQGVTLTCKDPVQDETVLIPAAVSKPPGT